DIISQRLGYLMRSGRPDSLDLMAATNFAVMAADLAVEGSRGRMVALRNGSYTNVPVSVTGEGAKRVDIDALYDVESYRPKVRQVAGKPMFLY
ncbi:MAG: phosphofructokinase, partial [Nitriliruptoraceae bacterium]